MAPAGRAAVTRFGAAGLDGVALPFRATPPMRAPRIFLAAVPVAICKALGLYLIRPLRPVAMPTFKRLADSLIVRAIAPI
jgi:hypothetical protein